MCLQRGDAEARRNAEQDQWCVPAGETVNQAVQSWIGHAMPGDTWRLREQIFEAFPFLAGVQRAG